MNQRAQFLWIGTELSLMERVCLTSFVTSGYDVRLYTYGNLRGVPDGVKIENASDIINSDRIFKSPGPNGGSYAPFADLFRYHLIFKKGGWWFDVDHISVKSLPEPQCLQFASAWERFVGPRISNHAIWSRPKDDRIERIIYCSEKLIRDGSLHFTSLGPSLLHDLVCENVLTEKNIAPWWEFYPYSYSVVDRLAFKTNREAAKSYARLLHHLIKERRTTWLKAGYVRKGTRAIHLWNEFWRIKNLDKNDVYHFMSPYGRYQRKLLPLLDRN